MLLVRCSPHIGRYLSNISHWSSADYVLFETVLDEWRCRRCLAFCSIGVASIERLPLHCTAWHLTRLCGSNVAARATPAAALRNQVEAGVRGLCQMKFAALVRQLTAVVPQQKIAQ